VYPTDKPKLSRWLPKGENPANVGGNKRKQYRGGIGQVPGGEYKGMGGGGKGRAAWPKMRENGDTTLGYVRQKDEKGAGTTGLPGRGL